MRGETITLATADEAAFATLREWQDSNGNGITDAGELKTLSEVGIASISLATTVPAITTASGNTFTGQSTITLTNGQTRSIADVILEANQSDTTYLGDNTVSLAAANDNVFSDNYLSLAA